MVKYYGISRYYPRLRRFFGEKTVAYIRLCRPFTGLAPLSAGLLGTLAPLSTVTLEHIKMGIYVGLTLMMLQFTGQIINQYADVELDKAIDNKRSRPLPSGLLSREEALGLSWLLAIFAVGRGFTISVFFGLITLLLLFFSVFYSLTPFSPRRLNCFLNTGWMAISRGFLPTFAVLSIYGRIEDALPWAVFGFLWVSAYQATKDIHDADADRKFGIKTIPNIYGVKGLQAYMLTMTIIMWIYSITFLPVTLPLVPISILAIIGVNKKVNGLENNLSWCCFYLGLSATYLLMFITAAPKLCVQQRTV
jgi:4-hydroxybenzoate polyprenyltransferase